MLSVKQQLEQNGCIKFDEDTFIYTQEHIIESQKEWDESDKAKDFDFTTSKYWAIYSNKHGEVETEGFDKLSDICLTINL